MYDSISWNNCFIQKEKQIQKLRGKAKVMKLSLSSRVSIILENTSRPFPIVLVKFWKVAQWNAKKLLKNFTIITNIGQEK